MANTSVVLPDWVMLDRCGRANYYYDDDDPAAVPEALKNRDDTTAVAVDTSSGRSGYLSFTLASPPRISYLDLHWPRGRTTSSGFPVDLVYSSVVAADENLLLVRVAIPSLLSCYGKVPHDLFVYTAGAGPPPPSLQRLPRYTGPSPKGFGKFFVSRIGVAILRLAGDDQGRYVEAGLVVSEESSSRYNKKKTAQLGLCVFSPASKTMSSNWRVFTKPAPQASNGRHFPVSWLTTTVLPFDGRFLCWVDYLTGVLLSDFSAMDSPVLRFLPFPGKQYTDRVRRGTARSCPDRYRSVSVSRGVMRFVHIDNDFHERNIDLDTDDTVGYKCPEKNRPEPRPKPGSKITIWTLNTMDGDDFKWELQTIIHLDNLWARRSYQIRGIPRRLPEFPVIAVGDDPDLLWCLLREKEFRGKAWMMVVDMKRAELRSCTRYANHHLDGGANMENYFHNVPPLPTVFSKYLNNTTGILDSDKFASRPSKKVKLSM